MWVAQLSIVKHSRRNAMNEVWVKQNNNKLPRNALAEAVALAF